MADIMTESDIDDQPISRAELLINMLLDDSLAEPDYVELSTMLERSGDVRQMYVELCTLHAELLEHYRKPSETRKAKSPVLGFLGEATGVKSNSALGETGS